MQKLIITDIAKHNDTWYSLHFRGDIVSLSSLNAILARQGEDNAYQDGNAWMINIALLRKLSHRFANLERALVVADRVEATKKINKLVSRR
jgi:hypothetical protein